MVVSFPGGTGTGVSGWLNLLTMFLTLPAAGDFKGFPLSGCGGSETGLEGSGGLGFTSGLVGRGDVAQTEDSGAADIFLWIWLTHNWASKLDSLPHDHIQNLPAIDRLVPSYPTFDDWCSLPPSELNVKRDSLL